MTQASTISHSPLLTERHGSLLVARLAQPPVNALGGAMRQALAEALAMALADDRLAALLVIGSGALFSGGADIGEFGKPMQPPLLPALVDRFEDSSKPTLAAINGTAMGGALELAMACHYRLAADNAMLGLPEVKIGLLPGAGGTQRMPRLIGAAAALDLIVAGKTVKAAQALELGLVDRVAPAQDFDRVALAWAQDLIAQRVPVRPTRERVVIGDAAVFEETAKRLGKGPANFAALRCVQSVRAALDLPFRLGQQREAELFNECAASPTSASLIHVFFAERHAAKVPRLAIDNPAREIRTAAVLGAGTMGAGIAIALADAGIEVALIDNAQPSLQRGLAQIGAHYRTMAAKGRYGIDEAQRRHARVRAGETAALAQCDLVIEAVFEDLALKQKVFTDLDTTCKPGAILASNTSTLDIDAIAAATRRPQDVLGLHFFSPANVMRLLEIVRGEHTADDVLASALALAKTLGKVGVVCGVCDGFIGNRMLEGYAREAGLLLLEGASPAQIDAAITAFGLAMGPFAMSDLAGIDVGYRVRHQRGVAGTDEKYYAVADRLYHQGRYGQKTGAGFYRYEAGNRAPMADPEVDRIIAEESQRLGVARRAIAADEIAQRCLLPLINEGARILEEGIAARAGDIDLVWIYGYGFPAWRGGPMHYANTLGLDKVYDLLSRSGRDDPFWKPAALIRRLAGEGGGFT